MIRTEFAQVVANKLNVSKVDAVKSLMEKAAAHIPTTAGDEVEVNFEAVSKAIASNDTPGALALKDKAPKAVEAFGNTFIFGYGSIQNKNFQSYGDGIFSFEGGNMAQKDVTFMVDTTPGQDGIEWMLLDNSKLPKKS